MHVEIRLALNFLISFLYNKLPRRRVNQFGEELEKVLKKKFQGHWYPERPVKGSAYRCVKTTLPLDPTFEIAARESGMHMQDIQDNLPKDLSMWIDPGEVSYRLGEKGIVKMLFSETDHMDDVHDLEICRTFNPEAQCFEPVDNISAHLGTLSLQSTANSTPTPVSSYSSSPPPSLPPPPPAKSPSPVTAFVPKSSAPLTFTTATFAQTKFGSTKLKSSGKRSQRLSPTEFNNYSRQRSSIQSSGHHGASSGVASAMFPSTPRPSHRPRSVSPNSRQSLDRFLVSGQKFNMGNGVPSSSSSTALPFASSTMFDTTNSGYLNDLLSQVNTSSTHLPAKISLGQQDQRSSSHLTGTMPFVEKSFISNNNGVNFNVGENNQKLFSQDSSSFNLNAMTYPIQYHHLLVAN